MDLLGEIFSQLLLKKSTQDSVTGALFHPQDLSKTIYLNGAPPVPFLRRLSTEQVNGDPHIWSEIAINSANGTSAYFFEGDAPGIISSSPTRLQNNIFQVGLSAEVTDKESALYANPGGFKLADESRERWFREELALQMELRTREVTNEIDYILINGDENTVIPASQGRRDVQCRGLLRWLTINVVNASNANLDEDHIIDLAESIHNQYTGRYPQVLYVTSGQKKIINTWVTNIMFTRDRGLEAGKDVSSYNNGYFVTSVEIEPNMPIGTCAMVDHTMFKWGILIPLRAEPLARVATKLKRMITCYSTLICGNQRSSGKVINLAQ